MPHTSFDKGTQSNPHCALFAVLPADFEICTSSMHRITTIFPHPIAVWRTHNFPDRPVIVFLHDSLGCIALWRDFPEKLGVLTQCDVLVYDRQGYGDSCPFSYDQRDNDYMELEADLLIALLDEHQLQQVILFGHSDGGSIALIAAGKYPERVRAIITEGAHIFVEEETLQGIRVAATLYQTTDLKQKLEKYHGAKTDALFHAWADTWTSEAFRAWHITHWLPEIHCPALIIQGERDEYGTLAQVEGILAQSNGYSESLILPDAGHTPHKEVPETVLKKTAEFILNM